MINVNSIVSISYFSLAKWYKLSNTASALFFSHQTILLKDGMEKVLFIFSKCSPLNTPPEAKQENSSYLKLKN